MHADLQCGGAISGLVPQRGSQMEAFFRDNKPDLVILSGDWLEYARPPRFDGMIADLRNTIAELNGLGIRVVLLGPPVQFKGRLPPMLLRLHLRGAMRAPTICCCRMCSRWMRK